MISLKNISNIHLLCRICLTSSKNMIPLTSHINKNANKFKISEVLEYVMTVKLNVSENYPSFVCPICLGLLKIAMELRMSYRKSYKILKRHFRDMKSEKRKRILESPDNRNAIKSTTTSQVELIWGRHHYDIKDLLIIEDELNDKENFEGFLRNLGNEITAKFVRNMSKKCEEIKKLSDFTENSVTAGPDLKELDRLDANFNNIFAEGPKEADIVRTEIQNLNPLNTTMAANSGSNEFLSNLIENTDKEANFDQLDDLEKNLQEIYKEGNYTLPDPAIQCNFDYTLINSDNLQKEPNPLDQEEDIIILVEEENSQNQQIETNCDIDQYILRYGKKCSELSNTTVVNNFICDKTSKDLIKSAMNVNFQCKNCKKLFTMQRRYLRHIKNCKIKLTFVDGVEMQSFVCIKCNNIFSKRNLYIKHLSSCKNDQKCRKCGKTFLERDIYVQHVKNCNGSVISNVKKLAYNYRCIDCKKMYSIKSRYLKHLKVCANSKNNYKCKHCNEIFTSDEDLQVHIKTVHQQFFKCNYCDHVSCSNRTRLYHQLKHGERQYLCTVCNAKFYTKSLLNNHKQKHQKHVTKVLCPVCGKRFHYKSGLTNHMKIHNNERNHQCMLCSKKFYMMSSLKRHTKIHTGEKPFSCKICDKRFCTSGELRKHNMFHTGFRPYICMYCKKSFSSAFGRRTHCLTHTGSFKCDICDRTFIELIWLKIHLKSKHNVLYENLKYQE